MKANAVKYYMITDDLIERLARYSKPSIFKDEYLKAIHELKKNKIPEGTMTLRCLGFNSEGKNFKIDIPINFRRE